MGTWSLRGPISSIYIPFNTAMSKGGEGNGSENEINDGGMSQGKVRSVLDLLQPSGHKLMEFSINHKFIYQGLFKAFKVLYKK